MWRPGDGIHDNDWEEEHRDAGDITQLFDGLAGASEWVLLKTFQPISSQDFYKELWEFLSNTGMKESLVWCNFIINMFAQIIFLQNGNFNLFDFVTC